MSLSRKLMIGFGAILVLSICPGVSSLTSMSVMRAEIDRVANQHAAKVDLAGQISTGAAEMLRLENGIILRLILQDQARSDAYKQAVPADVRQGAVAHPPDGARFRAASRTASLATIRTGVERWIGMHREMIRCSTPSSSTAPRK